MGDGFQEGQSGIGRVEVGSKGLEHHLPRSGVSGLDQLRHVEEPAFMMEEELSDPQVALLDDGSVSRVGDSNSKVEEFLKRGQVVAQDIIQVRVIHDHRGDPGEYVVTREEDAGPGIPEGRCAPARGPVCALLRAIFRHLGR